MNRERSEFWVAVLALACIAAAWLLHAAAAERSGEWERVRAAHVRAEPYCALCGSTNALEVHHLAPFHLHPDLELQETNLITLCRHCHLQAGHLGHWTNEVRGLRELIGGAGARLHAERIRRQRRLATNATVRAD